MSIFEYNQEAHMECVRQEGYDVGHAEGRAEGRAETIYSLVEKKLLTMEDAAKELGVSVDVLMVRLKEKN